MDAVAAITYKEKVAIKLLEDQEHMEGWQAVKAREDREVSEVQEEEEEV